MSDISSIKVGSTTYTIKDSSALRAADLSPYRTASDQDEIDRGKQATLVSGTNIKTIDGESLLGSGDLPIQRPNTNLLINGWFTVNQRGQNAYSTPGGVVFDMWRKMSGITITMLSSGIRLVNDGSLSGSWALSQYCEQPLKPGKYTASINIASRSGSGDVRISIPAVSKSSPYYTAPGLYSYTFEVGSTFNLSNPIFVIETRPNLALTIDIIAVKLEVGELSTLQYDNVPNYSEELLKCQRYFILLPCRSNSFTVVGSGVPFNNSRVDIPINLRVPMRDTPSLIVISGNVSDLLLRGNASQHNVSSLGVTGLSVDKSTLYMTVNTSGVITNHTYTLTNQNYRVGFSAEL